MICIHPENWPKFFEILGKYFLPVYPTPIVQAVLRWQTASNPRCTDGLLRASGPILTPDTEKVRAPDCSWQPSYEKEEDVIYEEINTVSGKGRN